MEQASSPLSPMVCAFSKCLAQLATVKWWPFFYARPYIIEAIKAKHVAFKCITAKLQILFKRRFLYVATLRLFRLNFWFLSS